MPDLLDAGQLGRKIAMFAAGLAQRQARSAPVQILIRDGRHVDDSLDPIWDKMHDEGLAGMTTLGRHLAPAGSGAGPLGSRRFLPGEKTSRGAAPHRCVYQKLSLGRSGDEVRLGWQVT